MKNIKICVAIPTYNHSRKLEELLAGIPEGVDAFVLDDGSLPPIELKSARAKLLRFPVNRGKAETLKSAFKSASEHGYSHVLTMDADGQHEPKFIADFISAARENPESIIVGVRDFENSAIPRGRKFLNKFSNFWFKAETGVEIFDTQCGFRCYPLSKISELKLDFGGFVFEVELLVKAAWTGIGIRQIPVSAVYDKETIEGSHYRPFADTLKFTAMNTKLFFASLLFSRETLKRMSLKK